MLKKERGITLVALVVTVIILLIIAGVAVSMITGNDGLFSKANDAGTRYNESAQNEADEINDLMALMQNGDNTQAINPLETADLVIRTVDEFVAFRNSVNVGNTYKDKLVCLANDIDLADVCSTTKGSFEQIGNSTSEKYFEGTFDGLGHKIINLYIKESKDFVGLFTKNYGIIQNLVLDNFYIKNTYAAGYSYTSALAADNLGNVINCASINGSINADGTDCNYVRYTSGLVSRNDGEIKNSYNTSNIYASNHSTTNGYCQVNCAGIVSVNRGNVSNCYNVGTIIANDGYYSIAGGVVSGTNGEEYSIENCYNIGNIIVNSGSIKVSAGVIAVNGRNADFIYSKTANLYTIKSKATLNKKTNHSPFQTAAETTGVVTVNEMKSDTVLTALGSAFVRDTKGINNGYPILAWQVSK